MKKGLTKKEVIVNGKIWTKESLQELIATNDTALYTAMIRIFNKQTNDEVMEEDTYLHNDRGFSSIDGKIMTSISKFYLKRKYVTIKQKAIIREKMKKYCGQLLKIMAADNIQDNEHFFKTQKRK